MRRFVTTVLWASLVFSFTGPPLRAAELFVSGFKLSDPEYLTNIELFLSDVPGVTGVQARTAGGTVITLGPAGPPSQFFLFLGPFASFAEFRAATVGNWQLTLEFAGGSAVFDFVVNDFRTPFSEADFPAAPTMLSPTDGATNIGPTPTFQWDSGGPHTGPLESLFVNLYSIADPSVFAMEGSFGGGLTLASTSWTPPIALPPGSAMFLVQYETNENEEAIVDDPVFNAAASTMADPGISWEITGGDLYARDLITFTVVPEPAGWLLLIAGLLTLSYWRRGPNGRNPRTRRASRSASAVQANMV